jgi:hypothetical protein
MTTSTQTVNLDTIMGEGNAPVTDGLVRVKGAISAGGTLTIRDRNNAFRAIKYTAATALAATEYVVIDMATLTARLQTSNTWDMSTGTDVSSRVSTSGDGAFYLMPAPGPNFPAGPWSYTVTAVGVSAAATAGFELRVRRSFHA